MSSRLNVPILKVLMTLLLIGCDSNAFKSSSLEQPSCNQNTVANSLSRDEVLVGDMILPVEDIYDKEDLLKYWPEKAFLEHEHDSVTSSGVFSQSFRRWDDGILPIEFAPDVNADLRNRIVVACAKISAVADVTCIERTDEEFYVRATTADPGCFATVGRSRGGVLNLRGGCRQETVIIHELMHNLGYMHEQQHPDRDDFVRVIEENVIEGRISNFVKLSPNNGTASDLTLSGFNLDSIMLYFSGTFAVSSDRPSIVRRSPTCDAIATTNFPNECIIPYNQGLSAGDSEILATVYGEPSGEPIIVPPIDLIDPDEPTGDRVCSTSF